MGVDKKKILLEMADYMADNPLDSHQSIAKMFAVKYGTSERTMWRYLKLVPAIHERKEQQRADNEQEAVKTGQMQERATAVMGDLAQYIITPGLSDEAVSWIIGMVEVLKTKIEIGFLDTGSLSSLVNAYDLKRRAQEALLREGAVVEEKGRSIPSPHTKMYAQASATLEKILKEYGLTYKSRERMPGMKDKTKEKSPLALLASRRSRQNEIENEQQQRLF